MGNFNRTRRVALAVLVLACSLPVQAEALWAALVWQNDFFVGHDGGGYTNGLFIARFREPGAGQRGVEAPVLVRPLLGVMGLAEGTAEVSRATHTLGQVMITPKLAAAGSSASSDSSAPLDKADVPYAGQTLLGRRARTTVATSCTVRGRARTWPSPVQRPRGSSR